MNIRWQNRASAPRLFVSSGKLYLEREALKIAIGVLNPPSYIDLPLTQKVAFKECLNGVMAFTAND